MSIITEKRVSVNRNPLNSCLLYLKMTKLVYKICYNQRVKLKNSSPKYLLALCRPTVDQQSADKRPTVSQQMTNRWPTNGHRNFCTVSQLNVSASSSCAQTANARKSAWGGGGAGWELGAGIYYCISS